MAEEALTRIGQDELRSAVDGGLRMDAVMYMQAALDRFAKLDQAKVGQIVMEIALLGRNGLDREYEAAVKMRRKR